jgi:glyoxylase-like metal-dependent hydrolase (beta-lactamase superfamily II)
MVKKITENVYLVEGKSNGRFPYCHSVLIKDKVTALIETGCGRDILKEIDEEFSPDIAIYSHAHPDHCAGSSFFPAEKLWGPAEHKETTGTVRLMAKRLVAPVLEDDWVSLMTGSPQLRDFEVGNYFEDGHVFDLGTKSIKAVHAPGHTEDHYCFYLPNDKIMVTTDIDFTSFGPWYANPESDIDDFIDSIEKVRSYDIETVVSSHLGVIQNGIQEKFDQFLVLFEEREKSILEFLDSPRTIEDFVEESLIYHGYPYGVSILRFFEGQMVGKHLKRLIKRGLVKEVDGKFVQA